MDLQWFDKIEVEDYRIFEEIETKRKVVLSREFKEFIQKYNGASPNRYYCIIDGNEEIFGAVLSFNYKCEKGSNIFIALDLVDEQRLIPFAIDPFGNYFCYDTYSRTVAFWDIEVANYTTTNKMLNDFIEMLF